MSFEPTTSCLPCSQFYGLNYPPNDELHLSQPLSTCSSYHKTIRKSPYWLQFKYQFKYHWQLTFYIFLLPSSLRHKLVWLPESVSRLIFWSIVPKFKNECSKKLYDINDHYVTYVYISCTVYNRENTSEYDKVSN